NDDRSSANPRGPLDCRVRYSVGHRAGDREAAHSEPAAQAARDLDAVVGGSSGTGDRDHGRGAQLAKPLSAAGDVEHARGGGLAQRTRISRVVAADWLSALFFGELSGVEAFVSRAQLRGAAAGQGSQELLIAQREHLEQALRPPTAVVERRAQAREQPAASLAIR